MKQTADNQSQALQKNVGTSTQVAQSAESDVLVVANAQHLLNRTSQDDALQSQTTLLANDQFQPAQRLALANQIGHTHSNHHLQRVFATARDHLQRQQRQTTTPTRQQRIETLARRITAALTQTETAGDPRESDTRTSAGVKASYASLVQATAEWSINVLKNIRPEEQLRREFNLTRREVLSAEDRAIKVNRLWRAVHALPTGIEPDAFVSTPRHRTLFTESGLTTADLGRMLKFRTLYVQMMAAYSRAGGNEAARQPTATRMAATPIARELGLQARDLTTYIRLGPGEDRSAWQRLGVERIPAEQPGQQTIGERIRAAATAQQGLQLARYEIPRLIGAHLQANPRATDEAICLFIAREHNRRAPQSYRDEVLRHFRTTR